MATVTREREELIERYKAWWHTWAGVNHDGTIFANELLQGFIRLTAALASAPPAAPPEDARMKATADRLELALNGALLGRGVTVSQIQRTYRLNYSDAKRLHDFRGVCFDVLGVLLTAASAAPPDPPGLADDRCAVCGWPLDPKEQMCRRGNCSMRPMPERAADPARAIAEYSAVWGGMARQTLQRWQEQLAEQIGRQSDPPGLVANWRPIETAPKRTDVLAGWADRPHWLPQVLQQDDAGMWFNGEESDYRPPTHWMPLPAAPQAETKGDE